MRGAPGPALAALLFILLLSVGTASAQEVIYDQRPLLADGSSLDLYEGATLEIVEVNPGVGLRLRLNWDGNTQSVNVVEGGGYTLEVDEEPYVRVSEIQTFESRGGDNYSYARVQQYLGYDIALRNCTINQTGEKFRVRFHLENRGFRWVDVNLNLVAGGESTRKTYTVPGESAIRGAVEMEWNLTEDGPVESYTLIARATDERETKNNLCQHPSGEATTPTATPVDKATATQTPTATESPTPAVEDIETGTPETTDGEGQTPRPTETPAPQSPMLAPAALYAAALLLRR